MTSIDIRIDVRKVTGRIGAEVRGVDLSDELDSATVAALRAAVNEHKVLAFRDVSLDDAGQERFARSGELYTPSGANEEFGAQIPLQGTDRG